MGTEHTVGSYLASRLYEIGIRRYFAVPGDYNLVLLDELLKHPGLQMIGCCNELNAGYAADGYARATDGPAAAVVTFSVGGLSISNAVAGAYAEDLPLIAISGGPNTNSESEYELLHHTLGDVRYGYQREIFAHMTAETAVLRHPSLAPGQIDRALGIALTQRKPVYIEVACNIAGASTSAPVRRRFASPLQSDPEALRAAVDRAAEILNEAQRPTVVAGVKLRPAGAVDAFRTLVDKTGFGVAAMPNAKGFVSEENLNYLGIYWGPVSTPGCSEIIEGSDACLFAGPTFTDYTTCGHELGLSADRTIVATSTQVDLPGGLYTDVMMRDFLTVLATKLETNDGAVVAFNRIREEPKAWTPGLQDAPLTTRQVFARIENMLDSDSTVLVETGDSWFNGLDLRLPGKARFEIQLQYGSIGWSVGATLGCALGMSCGRLISCIGDGSFQMSAQEISTMIRYQTNPIIFLLNNGGYTIEVEIHDGPYNNIQDWRYAELIDVFNGADGTGWGCRVATEGELDAAIETASNHEGVCLIEVILDRDDCNKKLLRWGNRVARNNGREPHVRTESKR